MNKYLVIKFVSQELTDNHYIEAKSIKEALNKTINKDGKLSFINVSLPVFIRTLYHTRVVVQNIITGRNYYYVRQTRV